MNKIVPNKSLGQHWLHDRDSLIAIMQAANVAPDDTILEIGPGLGTLTDILLEAGAKVVAVEKDEKLVQSLDKKYSGNSSIKISSGDILTFDLRTLPIGYKVVANIPYYLTSRLIRILSESANHPEISVLLVQKEVAERVAARPGAMSLLSVTAQFYWEVSLGQLVPAELFTPPPKVDSQVLVMKKPNQPKFYDIDEKAFFQLVKSGFASRRKTLLNSLSSGLRADKKTVGKLLVSANINESARPQTLSLDDWHNLYISALGKRLLQ